MQYFWWYESLLLQSETCCFTRNICTHIVYMCFTIRGEHAVTEDVVGSIVLCHRSTIYTLHREIRLCNMFIFLLLCCGRWTTTFLFQLRFASYKNKKNIQLCGYLTVIPFERSAWVWTLNSSAENPYFLGRLSIEYNQSPPTHPCDTNEILHA